MEDEPVGGRKVDEWDTPLFKILEFTEDDCLKSKKWRDSISEWASALKTSLSFATAWMLISNFWS
jgi:hypothetical protein